MVATGLSYKADRHPARSCPPVTVQNHVQNTLGKLQLHNRVELVRYAIEHGLAGEFNSSYFRPTTMESGPTSGLT